MSVRTRPVSDSIRDVTSQLIARAHRSSVSTSGGRRTKRCRQGLRTSPPRMGTSGSSEPIIKSVGMGRTGRGSSIQQYPATGAIAAIRPASSVARRNVIAAPFEKPVTYTLRSSTRVRPRTSSITAARNPTSSTAARPTGVTWAPSFQRWGFVRNFGGASGSGRRPSGKTRVNPSRSAIKDKPVSSSAHLAVAPVP